MSTFTIDAIHMDPSGLLEALYTILAQANPTAAASFACRGWGAGLGLCPNAVDSLSKEEQLEFVECLVGVMNELGFEGVSLALSGVPSMERLQRPSEQLAAD